MAITGRHKKSLFYFNEALATAREIGNKTSEIMILTNLGGAIILSGNYEKAEEHLQNVLELIGERHHFSIPEVYLFLAQAFLGQNNNTQALPAAKRSLELSQKAENQEVIGEAW